MTPIASVVNLCLSQDGDRYIFGTEVSLSDSDPDAFDCSELIQWACARAGVQPSMPDGSWIQARHCNNNDMMIPVAVAVATYGALLFKFATDPLVGPRPSSAHVALSLGDRTTIEARGTRYGVGQFTAINRGWTHAALIPGCDYTQPDEEELMYPIYGDRDNRDRRQFYIEDWQVALAALRGYPYTSGDTNVPISAAGMVRGVYDDGMKLLVGMFTDSNGAGIGPREAQQIKGRLSGGVVHTHRVVVETPRARIETNTGIGET